jgi:uncharacterized membrane protein YtjA (UPF0391 family)
VKEFLEQLLQRNAPSPNPPPLMLHYAIVFLIIALIAGVLGFGALSGLAAEIAKICLVVFLILMLISFFSGRRPKL